jgi:hypothetical protein
MKWKEYRNETNGQIYLFALMLLEWGERQLRLHMIIRSDPPGQYHSHPSWGLRLVLWGGYTEELEPSTGKRRLLHWWPGRIGIVGPNYTHRIHDVWGRRSVSLWLRGKTRAPTFLRGPGWPPYLRNRGV